MMMKNKTFIKIYILISLITLLISIITIRYDALYLTNLNYLEHNTMLDIESKHVTFDPDITSKESIILKMESGKEEIMDKYIESLNEAEPPEDPGTPEEFDVSPEPSIRIQSVEPEELGVPGEPGWPEEFDLPEDPVTEEEEQESEIPDTDSSDVWEEDEESSSKEADNNKSPDKPAKRKLEDNTEESPNKKAK